MDVETQELFYLSMASFNNLLNTIVLQSENSKSKRSVWIRDIYRFREQQGFNNQLIPRIRVYDRAYFKDFMRMSPEIFDKLLAIVGPEITKKDTNWKTAIPASHRLALTIRFLATGETFKSLSFAFRIGRSTISSIVSEICHVIWEKLQPEYLKFPTKTEEWKRIASDFNSEWQFPHCLGAIDGKHIMVECPTNSGSLNYNYKGYFSKVLLALVDAQYRFIAVDIGYNGSSSDGGIFASSSLGQGLKSNLFSFPNPQSLPNSNINFPYVIIGDEAFPLTTYMMRPYPKHRQAMSHEQKIFNYRLSRARRIVENAFGILSSKWRVFRRPLKLCEKNIVNVIKACTCLHNYLLQENKQIYCSPGYTDFEDWKNTSHEGHWREEREHNGLTEIGRVSSNMSSRQAINMRNILASYFCAEGKVEWQDRIVYRAGNAN